MANPALDLIIQQYQNQQQQQLGTPDLLSQPPGTVAPQQAFSGYGPFGAPPQPQQQQGGQQQAPEAQPNPGVLEQALALQGALNSGGGLYALAQAIGLPQMDLFNQVGGGLQPALQPQQLAGQIQGNLLPGLESFGDTLTGFQYRPISGLPTPNLYQSAPYQPNQQATDALLNALATLIAQQPNA